MIDLGPDMWRLRVSYVDFSLSSLAVVRFSELFTKTLVKVLVVSESTPNKPVKSHWRRSGFINQFYGDFELGSRRAPLNIPKILVFSDLGSEGYQLSFRPIGLYLPNYKIFIWEYRGEVPENLTSEGFTALPDTRFEPPEWDWRANLPE